jgi:hypothetical protein
MKLDRLTVESVLQSMGHTTSATQHVKGAFLETAVDVDMGYCR